MENRADRAKALIGAKVREVMADDHDLAVTIMDNQEQAGEPLRFLYLSNQGTVAFWNLPDVREFLENALDSGWSCGGDLYDLDRGQWKFPLALCLTEIDLESILV